MLMQLDSSRLWIISLQQASLRHPLWIANSLRIMGEEMENSQRIYIKMTKVSKTLRKRDLPMTINMLKKDLMSTITWVSIQLFKETTNQGTALTLCALHATEAILTLRSMPRTSARLATRKLRSTKRTLKTTMQLTKWWDLKDSNSLTIHTFPKWITTRIPLKWWTISMENKKMATGIGKTL